MPSAARSFGMAALTTSLMDWSSRISAYDRASFACRYRLLNLSMRSGSVAKNDVSSPPPRMTASTCPVMWSWFRPIAANLMRAGPDSTACAASGSAAPRNVSAAAPAVAKDDFRNPRRSVRWVLMPRMLLERGKLVARPNRRPRVVADRDANLMRAAVAICAGGLERQHVAARLLALEAFKESVARCGRQGET